MNPSRGRNRGAKVSFVRGWLGVVVLALFAGCGDSEEDVGMVDDDAGDGGVGTVDDDAGDGGAGTPCSEAEMRTGEGTYYDFADGSGNCGFPATPDDRMVAAINHVDYAESAACGTCVRVTGPDGTVDVRIVDRCPECPEGDLDLSPEAFSMIAPLEAGRVPIRWEAIACPVSGPIVYHFKDGSNPWWTAIQLRNHTHPIAALEYESNETWVNVPRLDYNYFVEDAGMGEGPLRLRVTDVWGNTLEDSDIPLLDDAGAPGQAQFEAS